MKRDEEEPEAFGARLSRLRKERGLTQQALADVLDIHSSQVHRYESGVAEPAFQTIKALCLALRVSADELLFGRARLPKDDLQHLFEAVVALNKSNRKVVQTVVEALLRQFNTQS